MLGQVFGHNPNARLQFDGRDGHDYEIRRVDGQYVISRDGEVQEGMTPQQVFNACFGPDTGRTILFETLSALKTRFSEVADGNTVDVSQLVSDQWSRQPIGSGPGGSGGSGSTVPNSPAAGQPVDDSWSDWVDWSETPAEPETPEVAEISSTLEQTGGPEPVLTFSASFNPGMADSLFSGYLEIGGEYSFEAHQIPQYLLDLGCPNCTAEITVDMHGLEQRIGAEAVEQGIASLTSRGQTHAFIALLTSSEFQPGDISISVRMSNGRQVSDIDNFRGMVAGLFLMSQAVTSPPLSSVLTVRTA